MHASLKNTVELFTENMNVIKREFPLYNMLIKRLAALLYAQEGKRVDCGAIRQCYEMMRRNTRVLSMFRGYMSLCIAAMLSLTDDPEGLFKETVAVSEILKQEKFHSTESLAVSAYLIASQTERADYEDAAARMRRIYLDMKEHHRFLVGQDDYIYAAMFAVSGLQADAAVERMEQMYERLKGEFRSPGSVQALSQVLVLSGADDMAAERVIDLRNRFLSKKIRIDGSYTLPLLGLLACLPEEPQEVESEIEEVCAALRAEKGFGRLSVTSQELLLLAGFIVVGSYAGGLSEGARTAVLSSSIDILIAQQVAMVALIGSSTTVAASQS